MKSFLIIGATSAIARACCREWLKTSADGQGEPVRFFLAGRSREKLEQTALDLVARGASSARYHVLDLADIEAHGEMLEAARAALETIDVALLAHGTLPDQQACELDTHMVLQEFTNNAISFITLLTRLASLFEHQRQGTLAVVTSVAGDRGRPSNYFYGSNKAAVSTFCEGLRARLYKGGIHLIDIRPGFVNTPMTEDLGLPRILISMPETAGRKIVQGIDRRRDVLYVPAFWVPIMMIIRGIPRSLFKRLDL